MARAGRATGLLTWEPPELRAGWEPWLRACYAVFAVAFALTIVVDAFTHETVMLGLGLVDEAAGTLTQLEGQLDGLSPGWLAVMFPLGALVLAWNGKRPRKASFLLRSPNCATPSPMVRSLSPCLPMP